MTRVGIRRGVKLVPFAVDLSVSFDMMFIEADGLVVERLRVNSEAYSLAGCQPFSFISEIE